MRNQGNRPAKMKLSAVVFFAALALLTVSVSSAQPPPLRVSMTLVQNTSVSEAFCLDGSSPAYHFHKGHGAGAQNWLLQFEDLTMEFLSQDCQRKFEQDLRKRSLNFCMHVDFSGWESLGIKQILENIGLNGINALTGETRERIVRLFYANPRTVGTDGVLTGLRTYILGFDFLIRAEQVNDVMGFIIEGAERYYHASRDCPFFTLPKGVEFLRQIHCNPNIGVFVKPRAHELNVRGRVLRNMLAHTLLPREGHRNHVTCMDLYAMEKLCNGKLFDPGFLILNHMREIGRAPTTNLSYGALIMKLVMRAGIRIPVGEQIIPRRSTDVFDTTQLIRMGIVEVDGEWVLRRNQGASTSRASTSRAVPMDETTSPPNAPKRMREAAGIHGSIYNSYIRCKRRINNS